MTLPELGPLLGELVQPADPASRHPGLEAARLALVGELFERAGAAREFLGSGDESNARLSLAPAAWLELWDTAVAGSALSLVQAIEDGFHQAAAYSRFPRKRLATLMPSPGDKSVLAARLSAAGIGLESATALLGDRGTDWREALRRAAGETEVSWQQLQRTVAAEMEVWDRRIEEVRRWRRPWKPLLLAGAAALLLAAWVGLTLGGYLPVPEWFRPVAEWAWNRSWP